MIEIIDETTMSELEDIITRLQNICNSFDIIVSDFSESAGNQYSESKRKIKKYKNERK